MWGKVVGGKKSEVISGLCKGSQASRLYRMQVQKMVAFACSEGGVWGPLMSKGYPWDTHTGPLERLVVSAGLNWARTSLMFLKNNLSNHYYNEVGV